MTTVPDAAGWYLDEYDAPKFWDHVSLNGGQPYLSDPLARLESDAGQCWIWYGWTAKGYGRFKVFGKGEYAHRLAFRDFGNKLLDSLTVDHLCRNPLCVNPTHLEAVTQGENVRRGAIGHKTHCPQGHEYTDENSFIRHNIPRRCLTCLKESRRRTYLRRKAAGLT